MSGYEVLISFHFTLQVARASKLHASRRKYASTCHPRTAMYHSNLLSFGDAVDSLLTSIV